MIKTTKDQNLRLAARRRGGYIGKAPWKLLSGTF